MGGWWAWKGGFFWSGLVGLVGLGWALLLPAAAAAHGALVEYRPAPGVVVQALYDTGQPMAGAQITVFAPDNPARPWLAGTADDQGRFAFVPDPELPGAWAVQARLAGHGAMAHIDLAPTEPGAEVAVAPGAPGTGQRWIMALAVIWGFIGTALFFARRKDRV
jgi:nickel transport protein